MKHKTSQTKSSTISSNEIVDIENRRNRFLVKNSYILLNVILGFFSIVNYFEGAYERAIVELIILACSLIAMSINLILRKKGFIEFVTLTILILLFSYLYLDTSSSAIWYLTFPAMAFFILGQKGGIIISSVGGALMIALYLFDAHQQAPALENGFKLRLLSLYITFSILIYLFDHSRYMSYLSLQKMAKLIVKEEEKLHTIMSTSEPMIFAVNRDCSIELLKGNSLKNITATDQHFIGKKLNEVIKFQTDICIFIEETLLGKRIHKELSIGNRIFDTVFTPWRDGKGEIIGVIGMAMDVTEKINIRKELEMARKMEAIGKLAGGIAHDFNNMLGAISGYAELIKKKFATDNEKLTKYVDQILSATEHSSDLIYKLLAFSRKGIFQTGPIDIHATIREVIGLLKETRGKNIEIIENLSAENFTIIGDGSQIQNAIMNLAINSIDAMPDGGTLIISTSHATIDKEFLFKRIYRLAVGPYIRIKISDTGTGMSKEVMSKIFEPFFTTKEHGKGTGLGLASVYGSIKSHGGSIDTESKISEGTSFSIYLPLKPMISESKN